MARAGDRRRPVPWRRLWPLIFLCGAAAFAVGLWTARPPARHAGTGRVIAGMASNADWLDRPSRRDEEKPDLALSALGLRPGMSVADIGAGTGFMTVGLSRLVGPNGRVYANDIQPRLLDVLRSRVSREHLTNVEIVEGTSRDTRLPMGVLDLALLMDVYHEFTYPQAMLQSIGRAMKPDGWLVLIKYRGEDASLPIAATHRLRASEAIAEIQPEGFVFDHAVEILPRQHILFFRRRASTVTPAARTGPPQSDTRPTAP